MKTVIAITGGIGSGKSMLSRLLVLYGFPVYDADSKAQMLMNQAPEVRTALAALFGNTIYSCSGLNKAEVSRQIFQNPSLLQAVNAIVHPAVQEDFLHWSTQQPGEWVFIESAILFESGFEKLVDRIWCVCAPETLRKERAVKRSGLSEQAVEARMAAQISEEEKKVRSERLFINDNQHPLIPQLEAALQELGVIHDEATSYYFSS